MPSMDLDMLPKKKKGGSCLEDRLAFFTRISAHIDENMGLLWCGSMPFVIATAVACGKLTQGS